MPRTRILVADALPLASDALAIALGLFPGFSVFEERPVTGPAALEAALRLSPDVALIDYWIPGMDGPAVTRAIVSQAPNCRVIMLSWLSSPELIQAALDAGATGYVTKDVTTAQLGNALCEMVAGAGPLYAREVQDLIAERGEAAAEERALFESLTSRQAEILELLDLGWSAQQIADHLSISFKTVRNHISEVLLKTDTAAVTEALAKAHTCGFLKGDRRPPNSEPGTAI